MNLACKRNDFLLQAASFHGIAVVSLTCTFCNFIHQLMQQHAEFTLSYLLYPSILKMPYLQKMKGLRRNEDAIKNCSWYQKKITVFMRLPKPQITIHTHSCALYIIEKYRTVYLKDNHQMIARL